VVINPLKEEIFMKTRTRFLALAMVAALAIAGCGEDNNDNDDNDNVSPNPTSTAAAPTSTPEATTVNPTPTPAESPGTSPTGDTSPTPVQSPGGQVCEGEALTVTITSGAGSDLDTGWTGIAHNSVSIREASVTANLDCPGLATCTVDGSALVGTQFGSPLPLSAGGVSSCVTNEFREAITGTYDCATGCAESSVKLISRVFLVLDQDKPCPPCVGDPTPNDGVKGGSCDGGKTPGAACDVGGISDLFQNAGGAPPDAGMTSNDCQPSGSSVGELNIDLNPLTTGTATVDANVDCLSAAFPAGSCYCTGQVQPNACVPDGVCPASGVCEQNPPDGVCSGQTYRQCDLTAGNRDCEETFPGSGNCEAQPRPCFGTSISRTGQCGTETGTLAAIFCIPATRAAAINTVAGIPGPGAVTLPGSQVRALR
jgi:hypothetical protein